MKKMFFSRMAIAIMASVQFLVSCSKDDNNDTPQNEQPKHGEVINQEAAAQGYMVLKREDDASLNRTWDCYISCKEEDEPNVWVDLNNNGKKDEKEAVTSFTYYESGDFYNVDSPVSSGVIVVYGKVTKFGCDANNLTALEVSKNTNLVELGCGDNQLTALDVTKNTNLVGLHCGENQLTELDITKNLSLEGITCYHNKLTALDVTKNTKLEHLFCQKNSLTTLDIAKDVKLQHFECYENKLDKTNMEKIIAALPNYTTGGKPKFYGWGENENNYKSVELRNQVVGKGWMPYHSVGGTFKVWN